MREPREHMRRIRRTGARQVRADQFAFAADGKSDPVETSGLSARGDQIKAALIEPFAGKFLGDVADGNYAAPTQNDAIDLRCFVSEAENTAGSGEFGDLVSGQGKAAFAEAKENA
jgi:hypothetical protein